MFDCCTQHTEYRLRILISPIGLTLLNITNYQQKTKKAQEFYEMNGKSPPSSPSPGEPEIIVNDANIRYNEKKKLSLTLPLVNLVPTNELPEECDAVEASEQGQDDSDSIDPNDTNKKRAIYESDDTFIQAIFSQTIKSTTATPTDDEPSQSFDVVKLSTSNGTLNHEPEDEIGAQPIKAAEVDSKEPTAYTYFHQTIEEDDSPDLDLANHSANCNPINTLTATIFPQNNKPTAGPKDESSERDQSLDNSMNNNSTAFASNEAISESEQSLAELISLESDVSAFSFNTC